MEHIIKKCRLKNINFFSVLNVVRKPIPFLWTPKIKCPLSHRQSTLGGHKICYISLCSCCELLNI